MDRIDSMVQARIAVYPDSVRIPRNMRPMLAGGRMFAREPAIEGKVAAACSLRRNAI
jgi:hypothetical protein